MRILVAEDSSLLRQQIIRTFSDLNGVEVVGETQDAMEACGAIGELKPDVVILDILMRGGNGIEVLERIKRQDSFMVVIVLTHGIAPPYRKRSTEAGAEFFLDKSTDFQEMRGIIQRLNDQFNKIVKS